MRVAILELYRKLGRMGTRRINEQLSKYTETDVIRFHSPDFSCKELVGYDGVVLTGTRYLGTYGKKAKSSGIRDCILDLSDDGVHILGICGGNILLGDAFGYRRFELKQKERGWKKISITPQGKEDPIFMGLKNNFTAYTNHHYSLRFNDEEKILAVNEICPQAFLYEPNVHGFQFHPERKPKDESEYDGQIMLKNYVDTIKR